MCQVFLLFLLFHSSHFFLLINAHYCQWGYLNHVLRCKVTRLRQVSQIVIVTVMVTTFSSGS